MPNAQIKNLIEASLGGTVFLFGYSGPICFVILDHVTHIGTNYKLKPQRNVIRTRT